MKKTNKHLFLKIEFQILWNDQWPWNHRILYEQKRNNGKSNVLQKKVVQKY